MVSLTEVERRIVSAVSQKGEMKQGELAAALSMDPGQLSRNIKDLEEEKEIISSKMDGKDKILSIADGVDVSESGEVTVTSGVAFPLGDRLQDILQRVMKGKSRKNIDIIMENFRMFQGYQSPQGLRSLLMNWQIDAATQNVIVDTVFPGSGMGAQYGAGMPMPNQYGMNPGYQTMYGPNGQPIIIMNPSGNMYPPSGNGMPIILQQPNQQPPQPQQPLIIETKEKRRIQKPQVDKDGNVRKTKDGEVIYDIVEEPVTVEVNRGGSGGNTLTDAVKALESLANTGRTVGVLGNQQNSASSEKEKEMAKQIEELRQKNEALRDEAFKKQIADIQKETAESLQGMQAFMAKQQKEMLENLAHRDEINSLNLKHATETANLQAQVAAAKAAGSTVDERMLNQGKDLVKDMVGGSVMDVAKMMQGGGFRPPQLSGQAMSPQQAAAEFQRRMSGAAQ